MSGGENTTSIGKTKKAFLNTVLPNAGAEMNSVQAEFYDRLQACKSQLLVQDPDLRKFNKITEKYDELTQDMIAEAKKIFLKDATQKLVSQEKSQGAKIIVN